MQVLSIDNVEIRVRDWEAAVSWYEQRLGLVAAVREEDHQYCMLRPLSGSCYLALYADPTAEAGAPSRCMPSFRVADLSATVDRLREQDVEIRLDVSGGEEGFRHAEIADCEGNLIQLYEWYGER